MTYCNRTRAHSQRGWLALALIVLGALVAWQLAALLLVAPARSTAARGLPTAQVLVAAPLSQVVLPASRPQLITRQSNAADLPAPNAASPATDMPTPTSTPAPLPAIDAEPIATLFPTAPVEAAPVAPAAPGTAANVPILMYHYIRTVDASSDPTGYNLSITSDEFAQQVAWLHTQGYTAVSMAQAQSCIRGEGACPARPIALTFDDGYADAYSTALPILQQYGMRGTFYIVNSFVGQPGYMTWEQLAALRDSGMEIGAHTVSHLNLTTLDLATAKYEIGESKNELDRQLGINVTSFCYPAGFYDANIEALVQAAGFSNATTTRWDSDYSDILTLPRRRVAGGTSIDGFVGIVAGG